MGMKASKPFSTAARGDTIDWSDIKDRIDLAAVATALLGTPPGRRGERGRRLWWSCPFHEDPNPSFAVDPVKRSWKCYGCSERGDAADLVMRLNHFTFLEAAAYLAGKPTPSGKPATKPAKAPERPPEQASGLLLPDALALVESAAVRLWTPEGLAALEYLQRRGLTAETIRQARLGWTPGVMIPIDDGARYWRVSGITLSWHDGDRVALVKIRRLGEFKGSKYIEAYRDKPALYPTPEAVRPGKPLVVVEGEFDALLLGQALGDLAAVLTLGSASSKPEAPILMRLLAASPWFVATDNDPAGDLAAKEWPARAIRVRPPAPCKDWTEAHQYGINLRRWWTDRLKGIEAPALSTWDELAARRWGPAIGDPTPGIIIDQPNQPEETIS